MLVTNADAGWPLSDLGHPPSAAWQDRDWQVYWHRQNPNTRLIFARLRIDMNPFLTYIRKKIIRTSICPFCISRSDSMSHLFFECPIFHEKRMMMCNVIESHIPTWSHTDIDEKCICIWYFKCWYPVSLTRNIGQDNSCAITASLFRNLSCWQRLVQPVTKSWDRISLVLWNIALKPPVWETRSGIYCIEGPSEFYTLSAEMWLAVSGGQPLVYFGLPMFAVSQVD